MDFRHGDLRARCPGRTIFLNTVADTESTGTESTDTDRAASERAAGSEETNALLSRLRLIEDQPLESRAVAFAQIHEELHARLDSGDAAARIE